MAQDELAVLRERAFGPNADISGDPAAIERLRQLEAEALSPAVPHRSRSEATADGVMSEARSAAGAASPGETEFEAGPMAAAASESSSSAAAASAPALTRRIRVAWALSLVVAVVVAAGFTLWLFPPSPPHTAVLRPVLSAEEDPPFPLSGPAAEGVELRAFGTYLGVEVYGGGGCVIVAFPDTDDRQNASSVGCFGDGLRPMIEVWVPPDRVSSVDPTSVSISEELRERFPDGAVLRFTLDGDRVFVDVGALPDIDS